MDTQVLKLIRDIEPPEDRPLVAAFLLVQGDTVLGVCDQPTKLPFGVVDLTKPWKVLVGAINEFKEPEVMGVIAEAFPSDDEKKSCWRITSPIDGECRLIGSAGTMAGVIHNRLGVLHGNGCYEDVVALPPRIVVWAADPWSGEKPVKK